MQKTANYNLKKPEPNDPLRVEDFNENSDIIDGVLKNQTDNLATLATVVATKGNCRIEAGAYTGTGVYGSNNKNTLTFTKQPLAVFITGNSYNAFLIGNGSRGVVTDYNSSVHAMFPTWGNDGTVTWYSNADTGNQMNSGGIIYTYFALLN